MPSHEIGARSFPGTQKCATPLQQDTKAAPEALNRTPT